MITMMIRKRRRGRRGRSVEEEEGEGEGEGEEDRTTLHSERRGLKLKMGSFILQN